MEVKDRIKAILEYYGLGVSEFAERAKIKTAQAVYDLLSGKTKSISPSMERKILSCFQDINKVWLLTGEGNMLLSNRNVFQTVDNSGVVTIGSKEVNATNNHTTNNYPDCRNRDNELLQKAIDEISEQRKLVAKAQEQIDRLIVLLEKQQLS